MYFKGKWCSEREKEPLLGRFDSFQIGPRKNKKVRSYA